MSASSKWFIVLAFLLALFALVASTPAYAYTDAPPPEQTPLVLAPDAPLPLNHFWCYQITTSQPVSVSVKTQDQFDRRPKKTRVGAAVRLCNPVRKVHNAKTTEIKYPNDHLLLYDIGDAVTPPVLNVQVRNQFGIQQLAVYRPAEILMVPTRKRPHPAPQNTDHFKCYRVEGQPVNQTVGLQDQFQANNAITVMQPFLLCNPTRKYHKDRWTEVRNKDAHLVCYIVTTTQFSVTRKTLNQFRRETITTTQADMLCVPSRKKVLN